MTALMTALMTRSLISTPAIRTRVTTPRPLPCRIDP
ncbi:hypothetical protein EV188_103378 [Actinomycetospora succinea]|uniref:Uncharacterized protein n=1 Tax=Actinomycetospora succinea TaxID=663603 RepID=A0A4R6VHQ8_9PSEU|nr:hypothetical protein EV188_103378 [Actinomycetospora succinea]